MWNLKKQLYRDKRMNFVSALSQYPSQFHDFSSSISDVLQWNIAYIPQLKKDAKEFELLVNNRIDFCEDIWFYSFQTYLLDTFGRWEPFITHIKQIGKTPTKKHIKDLKHLWIASNSSDNLLSAVRMCYTIQEDVAQLLQETRHKMSSSDTRLSQDIFAWQDDVFGSDKFIENRIQEEDYWHDKQEQRQKIVEIINRKYTFTNKWIMVPKSSFRSLQEKLRWDYF